MERSSHRAQGLDPLCNVDVADGEFLDGEGGARECKSQRQFEQGFNGIHPGSNRQLLDLMGLLRNSFVSAGQELLRQSDGEAGIAVYGAYISNRGPGAESLDLAIGPCGKVLAKQSGFIRVDEIAKRDEVDSLDLTLKIFDSRNRCP